MTWSDLDSLFDPAWTEALGRRVFPLEAFLSHNRFDRSAEVALELQRRGVSIWHDAHADMADRQVRSKVSNAILGSRYVVVCVGLNFQDSHWVRAEYRPALEAERARKVTRVVVLQMHPGAQIPNELAKQPRFLFAEIDKLCTFILEGNLLPSDPIEG
jgi:TIR domain-containing protein